MKKLLIVFATLFLVLSPSLMAQRGYCDDLDAAIQIQAQQIDALHWQQMIAIENMDMNEYNRLQDEIDVMESHLEQLRASSNRLGCY